MTAEGTLHGLPMARPELHIGRAYAACGHDIAERIDPARLAGEQAVARRSILARQAFDDTWQRVAEGGSARMLEPQSCGSIVVADADTASGVRDLGGEKAR